MADICIRALYAIYDGNGGRQAPPGQTKANRPVFQTGEPPRANLRASRRRER